MNAKGFSAVEVAVLVVAVAIIALLGYVGYNAYVDQNGSSDTGNSSGVTTDETQKVPPVQSSEDLNTVEKQLDDTELDDTSSKEAESQATF